MAFTSHGQLINSPETQWVYAFLPKGELFQQASNYMRRKTGKYCSYTREGRTEMILQCLPTTTSYSMHLKHCSDILSFPCRSMFLHSQQASTKTRIPPPVMNMSQGCSHTKVGRSGLLALTACWKATTHIWNTEAACFFLHWSHTPTFRYCIENEHVWAQSEHKSGRTKMSCRSLPPRAGKDVIFTICTWTTVATCFHSDGKALVDIWKWMLLHRAEEEIAHHHAVGALDMFQGKGVCHFIFEYMLENKSHVSEIFLSWNILFESSDKTFSTLNLRVLWSKNTVIHSLLWQVHSAI